MERGGRALDLDDLSENPPLWVPRADFLALLACNASPTRAGEALWRTSERWVSAVRELAGGPEVLLAELDLWMSLLDQHSTLRVDVEERGCSLLWQNLPGIDAHPLECGFRRGALAGLLGVDLERVEHPECGARGEGPCRYALPGLVPESDPAHERVLREAMILAATVQGREAVFRRLATLAPANEPFPDIRGVRAVRRFMEELEDAVLVLGPNLWVLDANGAAERLFAMSLNELRGLSARDLLATESFERLQSMLPDLYEFGSVRALALEGRGRDGPVPLEVSGRVSGTGTTLVFIARDVSEHLRLERELERRNRLLADRNERIAEADELKSEFLANVSHELTTPLTCIKGFSRLLHGDALEEAAGGGRRLEIDKRLEFLSIMQRESERVLDLIRGLLELSTIESGAVALDRARVSLNGLIRECLLVLKPRLDERSLLVDCRLDESAPPALLDPNRIKQVILNLVDNAVKFTPPGSAVEIGTACADGAIRLWVRNPSEDLNEADLERIFERFVQRDGTFKRQHGGVGLGLNLVRAIVQLHGGEVWADLPARGELRVTVELPVATL